MPGLADGTVWAYDTIVAKVTAGTPGNDTLHGDSYSQAFSGAAGNDALYGRDRVLDFSQTDGDLIDFSAIDANSTIADDQAFSFIGTDAFASGIRGQLRFETRGDGNTWVQADLDGNTAVDFEIMLIGSRTLTAADFVL